MYTFSSLTNYSGVLQSSTVNANGAFPVFWSTTPSCTSRTRRTECRPVPAHVMVTSAGRGGACGMLGLVVAPPPPQPSPPAPDCTPLPASAAQRAASARQWSLRATGAQQSRVLRLLCDRKGGHLRVDPHLYDLTILGWKNPWSQRSERRYPKITASTGHT